MISAVITLVQVQIIIIISIHLQPHHARNIFVNHESGVDSQLGDRSSPFKTIQHVSINQLYISIAVSFLYSRLILSDIIII